VADIIEHLLSFIIPVSFYRLRNYVNKQIICFTTVLYLVYSRIQNEIIVWVTADDKQLKIIQVKLNKILRIILSRNIYDRSSDRSI